MTTSRTPICSIVIRCLNEEGYIGRLLSGIEEQTIKDTEIIVVDSGSTDGTLAIVSHFPIQLLTIAPDEFTFGRSLNLGCKTATGEFIVIVSAHCYPLYRDWLERLLAPFSDPKVGLVYGRQRGNEQTKHSEHRIYAKWFPSASDLDQRQPFCNNANAAIRRALWQEQPYDETLTGLEDIAWANVAMGRGYKIAYAADAQIVHVHHETPRNIYNRYRREAIALKRLFPHEHFNLWDFLRLFTSNVLSDCVHALREGVLWSNLAEILLFRFMHFWGTFRGFAQHGPITSDLKKKFYYPTTSKRTRPELPDLQSPRWIDYSKKH